MHIPGLSIHGVLFCQRDTSRDRSNSMAQLQMQNSKYFFNSKSPDMLQHTARLFNLAEHLCHCLNYRLLCFRIWGQHQGLAWVCSSSLVERNLYCTNIMNITLASQFGFPLTDLKSFQNSPKVHIFTQQCSHLGAAKLSMKATRSGSKKLHELIGTARNIPCLKA